MSTVAKTTPTSVESAPRRNTLRLLSFIFIGVALLVSGYLTYAKLANTSMICVENSTVFNCEVVENSAYAYILGIPTAEVDRTVRLGIAGMRAGRVRESVQRPSSRPM